MNSKEKSSRLVMITLSSFIIMLTSTTIFLTNASYAQLSESIAPSSSSSSSSSTTLALPDNAVTITSPQDNQKVPVGQDIEVTGTSIANTASDCKITVNLNRVKPSQSVVAAGPGGANDYSQWSFTITSKYAPIQEGQNRVTAKISCSNDPNLKQFAHANVTGVASSSSSSVSDITLPPPSPQKSNPQTASPPMLPYLIKTIPNNDNNNVLSSDKPNRDSNLSGNNNNNNNKVVMLNFDDGYKSHFLYAKPILDKYGFKASFFIVCGKMETQPKWMSWQDIMALKDDGMDIESHTMTHAHLDSVSAQQLDYEIGYAKQCLADHGFDTTIFAYPKGLGSENETVVNVVSKYYDLARSGTENLFFLNCEGYEGRPPQSDCSTYASDGSLNYANRYDIKKFSLTHIDDTGNINLDESQMFDKFVQKINGQTAFNSNGKINAIPIVTYHNLTNSMQDYNSMSSTLTVSLFAQEMKYLHDNGFKVLLLNQLGYDMTHNAFYLKNSPATAAGAADTFAIRTTNTARAPTSVSTAIDKK
jgi:peptidoglycan/xylan/chitin deacetylase (PgdA/CDA1 family)